MWLCRRWWSDLRWRWSVVLLCVRGDDCISGTRVLSRLRCLVLVGSFWSILVDSCVAVSPVAGQVSIVGHACPKLESVRVHVGVWVRHWFARAESVRVGFVCRIALRWVRSPRFSVCAQEGPEKAAGYATLVGGVYEGSPLRDSIEGQAVALLVSPACCAC